MERTIIGIDPGISGGIAISFGNEKYEVHKMPSTFPEIFDFFTEFRDTNTIVYLEQVGLHVAGNNASSSAKFARHCGHIEMALYANSICTKTVTPVKWITLIPQIPKGMNKKRQRKNRIREVMQQAYPKVKVTLWNADALGILSYGLLKEKGTK